jgi:hypothetical protein
MNEQGVDASLSAANPIDRAAASELPLEQAESKLLAEIMAEPREVDPKPRGLARTRRRTGRYLVLGGVATAALVLFFVISAGGGPGSRPAPAFGAELVRFADSSPLILIGAPGWHVEDVQAISAEEGEMTFVQGAIHQPPAAFLNWRGGSLADWIRDRAASAEISTSAPVFGTTARVFQYEGGSPGSRGVTALWEEGGRVFEFGSHVPDMAVFEERLASLEKVDATTWLSALPPSVVKAADRDAVFQEMLKGIPVPPGFDVATIPGSELTTDRYQLGATLTTAVACTWFQDWARARRNDDEKGVRTAIAAMATAKDWPILREMSKTGDQPSILEEYAAAMPSGSWYGRPLIGDFNLGFGCYHLGIQLWRNPELEYPAWE